LNLIVSIAFHQFLLPQPKSRSRAPPIAVGMVRAVELT